MSVFSVRMKVGTMGCNSVACVYSCQRLGPSGSCPVCWCIVLSWHGIGTPFLSMLHFMNGSSSQLLFFSYSKPYCEFIILPVKLYCSHLADIRFLLFLFLVHNVDLANQNGGGRGGDFALFLFCFSRCTCGLLIDHPSCQRAFWFHTVGDKVFLMRVVVKPLVMLFFKLPSSSHMSLVVSDWSTHTHTPPPEL